MSELLITGARAVDPDTGLDANRDLLVREGQIAAIEEPGAFADLQNKLPRELQIDASGLVLAPGLIDIHVHLREPGQTHKETIASGTRAAAAGGFTTVVAMPNTTPVNDSVESLRWMLDSARGAVVHLLAMPAATFGSAGEEITDFDDLVRAGAVGFTDDGKPVLRNDVMRSALVMAAQVGVPISQHAEDTRMTGGCSMNAGPLAFRLGLRGMPVEAESSIVERDIRLVREIGCGLVLRPHLHVQHVSTARALAAIRKAKDEGLHVTCEAAPHHFTLTEDAVAGAGPHGVEYNTNAKMNPPLRSEQDRRAVLEGLMDGTVDCIATDHAPHASWEKNVEFERAPNGITGLETALGLTLRVLHKEHGVPLTRALALLTSEPAKILGLRDRGGLRKGSLADLVLFEPETEWTYAAAASHSKSRNTPFDGAPMLGRIHTTLVAGRRAFQAAASTRA